MGYINIGIILICIGFPLIVAYYGRNWQFAVMLSCLVLFWLFLWNMVQMIN